MARPSCPPRIVCVAHGFQASNLVLLCNAMWLLTLVFDELIKIPVADESAMIFGDMTVFELLILIYTFVVGSAAFSGFSMNRFRGVQVRTQKKWVLYKYSLIISMWFESVIVLGLLIEGEDATFRLKRIINADERIDYVWTKIRDDPFVYGILPMLIKMSCLIFMWEIFRLWPSVIENHRGMVLGIHRQSLTRHSASPSLEEVERVLGVGRSDVPRYLKKESSTLFVQAPFPQGLNPLGDANGNGNVNGEDGTTAPNSNSGDIETGELSTVQTQDKVTESKNGSDDSEGVASASEVPRAPASTTDDSTCIICFERDMSAVFLACGHGGSCPECAENLAFRRSQERKCPLCRENVDLIVVVSEELVEPSGWVEVVSLATWRETLVSNPESGSEHSSPIL